MYRFKIASNETSIAIRNLPGMIPQIQAIAMRNAPCNYRKDIAGAGMFPFQITDFTKLLKHLPSEYVSTLFPIAVQKEENETSGQPESFTERVQINDQSGNSNKNATSHKKSITMEKFQTTAVQNANGEFSLNVTQPEMIGSTIAMWIKAIFTLVSSEVVYATIVDLSWLQIHFGIGNHRGIKKKCRTREITRQLAVTLPPTLAGNQILLHQLSKKILRTKFEPSSLIQCIVSHKRLRENYRQVSQKPKSCTNNPHMNHKQEKYAANIASVQHLQGCVKDSNKRNEKKQEAVNDDNIDKLQQPKRHVDRPDVNKKQKGTIRRFGSFLRNTIFCCFPRRQL